MEAEEDDERDAKMRDNSPRKHPVVLGVEGHRVRLLCLKGANNPQGQVAKQQEGDQSAARLASDLVIIFCTASQAVKDEDGLR